MGNPDPPAIWPSDKLTFDLSAAELRTTGTAILTDCDARLAALLARGPAGPGAEFLDVLDAILLVAQDVSSHSRVVFNVHPDAETRAVGRELSEASDRFFNAFRLNAAIYENLGRIRPAPLVDDLRWTIEKMRKEMRLAGVEQPEAARTTLKALSDAIDAVSNQFAENIATKDRSIEVHSAADLAGLPPDYLSSHAPGPDGTVRITTRYPDFGPVMAYADSDDVRRRLMSEFMNRAHPENLPVLDDLLAKRFEFARKLDFPNFAALAVADKMMATPERARAFLKEVAEVVKPGSRSYYARVLGRKRRDAADATELEPWDDAFYSNKIRAEEYGVDARALRTYLPYGPVRDGLFALCRELFDLEFRPVPGGTWHPSVEAYDVLQAGRPLGRCFLDMVPRDGKFSHAACFSVRTGLNGVQVPQAALICNFVVANEPKETARMEYPNVVTFFHEFGHLLHAMFSGRQRWTYGHQLEWDFVEAPSLLFEEWARDPATLARFAKDPTTGATIPSEVLQRLDAADAFGRPMMWMRQVILSTISFGLYDRDPAGLDTSAYYRATWDALAPRRLPADYHPQASWGHLTGYSACYYTYVWSLVIARDLLQPFREKGNLTDPALAQRYAAEILAPGGRRPASASIEAFLGRPFNMRAFEAWVKAGEGRPPALAGHRAATAP